MDVVLAVEAELAVDAGAGGALDESPPPQALSRIAAHALAPTIAPNVFMVMLLVVAARR